MTIVTYEEFGKHAARMFNAAVAESYKDLLEKAVAEAVSAERQRCARVARQWDVDCPNTNYGGCIARLIEGKNP
jgi:hypothetical protein